MPNLLTLLKITLIASLIFLSLVQSTIGENLNVSKYQDSHGQPFYVNEPINYQANLENFSVNGNSIGCDIYFVAGPDKNNTNIKIAQKRHLDLLPESIYSKNAEFNFSQQDFGTGDFSKWLKGSASENIWKGAWWNVTFNSSMAFYLNQSKYGYGPLLKRSGNLPNQTPPKSFSNLINEKAYMAKSPNVFNYEIKINFSNKTNISLEVAPSRKGPWTYIGERLYNPPGIPQTLYWNNTHLTFSSGSAAYRIVWGEELRTFDGPMMQVEETDRSDYVISAIIFIIAFLIYLVIFEMNRRKKGIYSISIEYNLVKLSKWYAQGRNSLPWWSSSAFKLFGIVILIIFIAILLHPLDPLSLEQKSEGFNKSSSFGIISEWLIDRSVDSLMQDNVSFSRSLSSGPIFWMLLSKPKLFDKALANSSNLNETLLNSTILSSLSNNQAFESMFSADDVYNRVFNNDTIYKNIENAGIFGSNPSRIQNLHNTSLRNKTLEMAFKNIYLRSICYIEAVNTIIPRINKQVISDLYLNSSSRSLVIGAFLSDGETSAGVLKDIYDDPKSRSYTASILETDNALQYQLIKLNYPYPVLFISLLWFYWPMILALCILVELTFWYRKAKSSIQIENFTYDTKITDPGKKEGYDGLAALLSVRLNRLSRLYQQMDDSHPIISIAETNQPIPATIKTDDASNLDSKIFTDSSSLSILGLTISGSFINSLIGWIVRPPKINGSLYREGDNLVLTARYPSKKRNLGWRVERVDKAIPSDLSTSNPQQVKTIIDDMVSDLAFMIFSSLAFGENKEVPWEAVKYFTDGLRNYRECVHGTTDRRPKLLGSINSFEQCLGKDEDFPWAHYNLGVAYYETGKKEPAKASFERAIHLHSDNWQPYYAMALICYNTNECDKSIQLCRKAQSLKPNYIARAQILDLIALACKRYNNEHDCIEDSLLKAATCSLRGLRRATNAREPDDIEMASRVVDKCFEDLSLYLLEEKDCLNAEYLSDLALKLSPNNKGLHLTLAEACQERDPVKAQQNVNQGADLSDPRYLTCLVSNSSKIRNLSQLEKNVDLPYEWGKDICLPCDRNSEKLALYTILDNFSTASADTVGKLMESLSFANPTLTSINSIRDLYRIKCYFEGLKGYSVWQEDLEDWVNAEEALKSKQKDKGKIILESILKLEAVRDKVKNLSDLDIGNELKYATILHTLGSLYHFWYMKKSDSSLSNLKCLLKLLYDELPNYKFGVMKENLLLSLALGECDIRKLNDIVIKIPELSQRNDRDLKRLNDKVELEIANYDTNYSKNQLDIICKLIYEVLPDNRYNTIRVDLQGVRYLDENNTKKVDDIKRKIFELSQTGDETLKKLNDKVKLEIANYDTNYQNKEVYITFKLIYDELPDYGCRTIKEYLLWSLALGESDTKKLDEVLREIHKTREFLKTLYEKSYPVNEVYDANYPKSEVYDIFELIVNNIMKTSRDDLPNEYETIKERLLNKWNLSVPENELDKERIEELIKKSPLIALHRKNLGRYYLKINNYIQAREELKRALLMDPDDPRIMYNIGLTYMQEAQRAFSTDRAMYLGKMEKDNANFFKLGKDGRKKCLKSAKDILSNALKIFEEDTYKIRSCYWLGYVNYLMKNYKEMICYWETAKSMSEVNRLDMDEGLIITLALASAYLSTSNYNECDTELESLIKRIPDTSYNEDIGNRLGKPTTCGYIAAKANLNLALSYIQREICLDKAANYIEKALKIIDNIEPSDKIKLSDKSKLKAQYWDCKGWLEYKKYLTNLSERKPYQITDLHLGIFKLSTYEKISHISLSNATIEPTNDKSYVRINQTPDKPDKIFLKDAVIINPKVEEISIGNTTIKNIFIDKMALKNATIDENAAIGYDRIENGIIKSGYSCWTTKGKLKDILKNIVGIERAYILNARISNLELADETSPSKESSRSLLDSAIESLKQSAECSADPQGYFHQASVYKTMMEKEKDADRKAFFNEMFKIACEHADELDYFDELSDKLAALKGPVEKKDAAKKDANEASTSILLDIQGTAKGEMVPPKTKEDKTK